jgi:hypothetical protein
MNFPRVNSGALFQNPYFSNFIISYLSCLLWAATVINSVENMLLNNTQNTTALSATFIRAVTALPSHLPHVSSLMTVRNEFSD